MSKPLVLQTHRPPACATALTLADRGAILPFLVLLIVCVLPAAQFFFLSPGDIVSSQAPGTITVCLLAVGLLVLGIVPTRDAVRLINYISFGGVLAFTLLVHLAGSVFLGGGTEIGHTFQSLAVLMLMLGAAMALAALMRDRAGSLPRALAWVRWLLIGAAVLAAVNIRPFQGTWDKPVFPFSEPSHLALVLSPLLIHACVTSRGPRRVLWILGGLALGYAIESLTLIAGMLVAAAICLPLAGFAAAAGLAVVALPFVDLRYFADRLDLGANTQNLSSLIYRQGWELAGDALDRTSGWGVGFQQLGYATFRSPSADAIYVILKNDTNTRDGGFLLAKIVAEFGIVGVGMILSYLALAGWCAWRARRVALGRSPDTPGPFVFALCIVCSFSVDIFTRSLGYFSSSTLLFITALYVLWEAREPRRSRNASLAHRG